MQDFIDCLYGCTLKGNLGSTIIKSIFEEGTIPFLPKVHHLREE
jgi:hypothetical protein